MDSTRTGSDEFLKNIVVTGDILVTTDPGFKDITSTTDPAAYQLIKDSAASRPLRRAPRRVLFVPGWWWSDATGTGMLVASCYVSRR